MFIVALFTTAKTWNQSKCLSMIDWIEKMWHIYPMEYYAAIKNDGFMSFVGTQMNLETIILSKLIQEQKTKHWMFIGGCWTMRTHGHREGNITQWGLLGGGELGEGQWGTGRLERDNTGRNAGCRWWRDGDSKPPWHACTYATVLQDLHMYPRT